MECNKDEAIRSRNIAEQKFLLHDLMGAKKFALKAQRLFPALEGLPQLLAVLDVHIVAQDKVDGQDANWYGILQTSATADDVTIRQQYRKLALILHPDKNKAVGADGAFKLISEAWGVLSDKGKRAAHDAKRGRAIRPADGFCNFTNFNTRSWPLAKPAKKTPTCWAVCPVCRNHGQCSRVDANTMVLCAICQQAFAANATSGGDPTPKGKNNAVPMSKQQPEDHTVDGTGLAYAPSKADDTHTDGSAFERRGSDHHHMGAPMPSHCDPDELYINRTWNVRLDQEDSVQQGHNAPQSHPDRQADGSSSTSRHYEERLHTSNPCAEKSNTDSHSNFQFNWGSQRNRSMPNHTPAAVKATADMVRNVYETVKRERVVAQKEAREKAMKERIDAEKEARRQEHRARRERKQKKKEDELKKQAKVALHAKRAFDKLFARGSSKASLEDTEGGLKAASFLCCETDAAPEAGAVHTNAPEGHFDTKS